MNRLLEVLQQAVHYQLSGRSMADSGSKKRSNMAEALIAFDNIGNDEHRPERQADIQS
jgi:hypothetical protein